MNCSEWCAHSWQNPFTSRARACKHAQGTFESRAGAPVRELAEGKQFRIVPVDAPSPVARYRGESARRVLDGVHEDSLAW